MKGTHSSMSRGAVVAVFVAFAVGCASPDPAGRDASDGAAATDRERIDTDRAPAAIGPYSQGVRVGNTLYLAGQIALDPVTGEMIEGGIEAETTQVMENLGAVLDAADFTFDDVVQAQVFLVDLGDFAAMNGVYATYFGDVPPVRATVGVASLPRGALVEVMLTAVRD